MANVNAVDPSYFNSYAAELVGKFQRISHLVSHNATTGNYHEEILKSFLKHFLSDRFSIKSGFVFEDNERVSKQIDIIIVDESYPATYIFKEGDFAIVRPEAVVAVIEVKTTLNAAQFKMAVENIASAKSLMEFPTNLVGAIFGYETDGAAIISDTKISNWLRRSAVEQVRGNRGTTGPDIVTFFKDNSSLFRYNAQTNLIGDGDEYRKFYISPGVPRPEAETGWQLSMILALIISSCERREFQRTHMFGQGQANKLLGSENILVTDYAFKFGEGRLQDPVPEPSQAV